MLEKFYEKLGPLAPLIMVFVACLLLFTINRIGLGIYYANDISQVESFLLYLPVGMRTDLIILCMVFAIPFLLTLLLTKKWFSKITSLVIVYIILSLSVFVFFEIASWPFLEQFNSRPNQIFFRYFTHPKEVLAMVWAQYHWLIVFCAILLILGAKYLWRLLNIAFNFSEAWSYKRQLAHLPVVFLVLLLGARSGIGEATPNPSVAAFSNSYLTNQLALNATYSLTYAIYTTSKASMRSENLFGKMPKEEVYARLKNSMDVSTNAFISDKQPTLHKQESFVQTEKPRNLVVIVMEGWGAKRIGILGGYDITPNFDSLSEKGVLFTNIYSIGTRTSRGIEAIVVGYPPSARSTSILNQDLAQNGFFTIASLLQSHGYRSSFLYAGEAHFDNMAGFFLSNGFEEVIDENDIENPEFYGTWGVSDEDIFTKANEHFKGYGDIPFVSVILTISNHPPFDYPEDRIELVEQPSNTEKNATKYSDYALGQFFKMARKEEYFSNTVFLITGDHPISIKGNHNPIPVSRFRIPGLIISPDASPKKINTLGSQLDLPSTVISLLGLDLVHPMIGRNLLTVPPDKGRAIMIFGDNFAYQENNLVAVYQPHKSVQSYSIDNQGNFIAIEANIELMKNGLAYLLFPGIAFEDGVYRLP